MKAKPIIRREQANRDVDTAIASCLNDAGEAATLGFIEALENAYDLIGRHPAIGSPRYAHEFNLPGLRTWPLTRYPNSDRRCFLSREAAGRDPPYELREPPLMMDRERNTSARRLKKPD